MKYIPGTPQFMKYIPGIPEFYETYSWNSGILGNQEILKDILGFPRNTFLEFLNSGIPGMLRKCAVYTSREHVIQEFQEFLNSWKYIATI
jgi:hypothetical protein